MLYNLGDVIWQVVYQALINFLLKLLAEPEYALNRTDHIITASQISHWDAVRLVLDNGPYARLFLQLTRRGRG